MDLQLLLAIQALRLLRAEHSDLGRKCPYGCCHRIIWNWAQYDAIAEIFSKDGPGLPALAHSRGNRYLPPIRYHKTLRHGHEILPWSSASLPEQTVGRLADRADRSNMPSRTLAQRYVEEGLRMDEHPLIGFVDGPAGRRARLVGGPDVWEVIAIARDNNGDLSETAAYLELPLGLVQAAASYYGAHPQEIDERIEHNRRETHDAHRSFLAARDALGG